MSASTLNGRVQSQVMETHAAKTNPVSGSEPDIPRPTRFDLALYLVFARVFSMRRFQSLRVANADRLPADGDRGPMVIVLNHASWWDPLPFLLLQLKLLPNRVAYAPSDAEALRHAPRLRRLGSFPVATGTLSGTKTFIRDCRYVLSIPNSVLVVTPQGEFTDPRVRPLKLRRGVAALLSKMGQVTVMPLAFEYTFWTRTRPEILTSWGEPIRVESGTSMSIDEWHQALEASLTATMDELAGLSMRREHWRFRNIVYGRMGPRNFIELIKDLSTLLRGTA